MIRRLLPAWALVVAIVAAVTPRIALAQFGLVCDSTNSQEIRAVKFSGNRQFSDAELSLHIRTIAEDAGQHWARWLHFIGSRRCLDPLHTLVGGDIPLLKGFYAAQGFPRTTVDTAVTPVPGANGRFVVTFTIHEGDPIVVNPPPVVTGLDSLPQRNAILKGLNSFSAATRETPGRDSIPRYSTTRVAADVDSIRARLDNIGFPLNAIHVDPDTSGMSETHRVALRITVNLGPLARFGAITLAITPADTQKKQAISDAAVLQELRFAFGDVYSDRAITDAQRRLYGLGTYQHVGLSADTNQTRLTGRVGILDSLREDKVRQIDYEAGWATLDCFRTQAQYADKAFLHTTTVLTLNAQVSKLGWAGPTDFSVPHRLCDGKTMAKDTLASDTLNYKISATLRKPGLLGGLADPSISVYRETQGAYQAYLTETLIGGALGFTRDLGSNQTLQSGYNLSFGHTTAQPAVLCFIFHACDSQSQNELTGENRRLAVLSTSWTRVGQNDALNPSAGMNLRGEFRMSNRVIGSDTGLTFYKAVADATWYHTLIGSNILALRLRLGAVTGGTSAGGVSLPPPQERLYAGGATSVRGFQQNEVGALIYVIDTLPKSGTTLANTPEVIPVGGNQMLVGNVEYRLAGLFGLYESKIQPVVFTDVGYVGTPNSSAPHVGQQLRWTPGIGIRWASPIGLVTGNVGFNPYARPLGALYYSPPFSSGSSSNFALYCASPVNGVFPTTLAAIQAQSGGTNGSNCPATYTTGRPGTFFRQLAFTFSIGPDF